MVLRPDIGNSFVKEMKTVLYMLTVKSKVIIIRHVLVVVDVVPYEDTGGLSSEADLIDESRLAGRQHDKQAGRCSCRYTGN